MKNNMIPYGTDQFDEFEDDSNIKLKDAYDIHKDFINKNLHALPPCTKSGGLLYFAYDTDYVFGYFDPLDQEGRFSPNLVRVDANSGQARMAKSRLPLIERERLPKKFFRPRN